MGCVSSKSSAAPVEMQAPPEKLNTLSSLAASTEKVTKAAQVSSFSRDHNVPPVYSSDTSTQKSASNTNPISTSPSLLNLDQLKDKNANLQNKIVHIEVPFGKPIEEVYDGIHDGPILGTGVSGIVRLATHRATGTKYAVKCLDLNLVETKEGVHQLREEIAIMCQLDHPNIVRLEEVYESHSEIYMVQELCFGGELFDRLDEQPDYHYTEAQCARLIKQMLSAVRYIHSKGIIHRDLKLENFLFSSADADSELKLIDFGLSKHFKLGETQQEMVGTPYTVAPEVIRGSYDERCDVWAIGVITCLLLSGEPPFGGCGGPEPLMKVRSNILQGRYRFEPEEVWRVVSSQAKEFIRTLLVTDPRGRPTAKKCQESTWIAEWANKGRENEDKHLNPLVVRALVAFKEYSDMRKLLCEILSFTLLPEQTIHLRKEFEKVDVDGSGEISLSALKMALIRNTGAEGVAGRYSECGCGGGITLTEKEVEDVFNAMRVRKSETRIHWHEFVAAGLSQCKVDDRNLRLAFDRLDADHKGYISFGNFMDLVGGDDTAESEGAMTCMWRDAMLSCKCQTARILYEDFVFLMKGQTRRDSNTGAPLTTWNLDSTSEGKPVFDNERLPSSTPIDLPISPFVPFCQSSNAVDGAGMDVDGSLSIEDDDKVLPAQADILLEQQTLSSASGLDESSQDLTPPQSPVRGATDYATPMSNRRKFQLQSLRSAKTNDDSMKSAFAVPLLNADMTMRRARSAGNHEDQGGKDHAFDNLPRETVQLAHRRTETDSFPAVGTPLIGAKKLYNAHKQMRQAVMEASKRFEEEQMRRTAEKLKAQTEQADGIGRLGAGLVMRRGVKKELSSESVRRLMMENQMKQQSWVDKANKRGGRGQSRRTKTTSDMSAMICSFPTEVSTVNDGENFSIDWSIPEEQESTSPKQQQVVDSPSTQNTTDPLIVSPPSDVELHFNVMTQRKPTVPGQFRKTNDPFLQINGAAPVDGEENHD